jgi:hypothetical protein
MRNVLVVLTFFLFAGCTTVQIPTYIKADHPYTRKMYGDFEHIVSVAKRVLTHNGWKISSEEHPSIYERSVDEDKETAKDVVLLTEIKQHTRILYSSYSHLNVFLHATPEGAEVEVRYGKVMPLLIHQFSKTRNDALGNRLLNEIEQEMVRGK